VILALRIIEYVFPDLKRETITRVERNNVIYTLNDNNTATVSGFTGSDIVLVVEVEVEGHIVTEIGVDAFTRNTTLSEITFPDCISVIGERAFSGCTSLCSMN